MKQKLFLISLLVGIFFFWTNPILYPLKLLTVFFHESSHALMAIITGGEVVELVVTMDQGGHVLSNGGSRFLTLTAGYLGSLGWGVTIYISSVRTSYDKEIMFGLGIIIILIGLFFVRNLFGLGFSLFTGFTLIGLALKASEKINDFILRLIGLTSTMYVPLDIYSDTILRSHLRSDARMLAEEMGGTTLMWGGVWLLVSIYIAFHCLRLSHKKTDSVEMESF